MANRINKGPVKRNVTL